MGSVDRVAARDTAPQSPDLSLVVPCYNEEECLDLTIPPLAEVFQKAGVCLQLVLVDNGSTDRTSEVIDRLMDRGLPITKGFVPVNKGQGLGFLTGYALCRGKFAGHICADGQVAPEDVLKIYNLLAKSSKPAMSKARRRMRKDSWVRKVVSIVFNGGLLVIFPGIHSLDINGNPKIVPADVLRIMQLESIDWFLEAEMMLKARHLKLAILEIDVPGFPRQAGKSKVRFATILEFVRNLSAYVFGGMYRDWKSTAKLP